MKSTEVRDIFTDEQGVRWSITSNGRVEGYSPCGDLVKRFFTSNPPTEGSSDQKEFLRVLQTAEKKGLVRRIHVFATVF